MSYVDARLEFSSAQALTATADSTNVVDLTQSARQIGAGQPMWVHFNVTVAADVANGDETYQFNIATGSATSLGTQISTMTIPRATLVAGYTFSMAVPVERMERYVGVEYVLGGTSPSVTVDAYMSDQEAYTWTSYADAI